MNAMIKRYPNIPNAKGFFNAIMASNGRSLSSMATPLEKVYWGTQGRPFEVLII